MRIYPIQSGLKKAFDDTILLSMYGRYKDYVACHKELASKAVKNFDEYLDYARINIRVPLFSKEGLNILSVAIKDKFRRKTPDEKLLKKMLFEQKIRQKYQKGLYI